MSKKTHDPRAILNDPTLAFIEKVPLEQVIDLHGQVAIERINNALIAAGFGEKVEPNNFQMVFDRLAREYMLVYVPEKSGPLIVELSSRVVQERQLTKIFTSIVSGNMPDCNDPSCPDHGHGGKKPHELN